MTDIERAATNVNITGITSDADVNKVLNLTEQSTLVSLRSESHKDVNGNVIGKLETLSRKIHISC